ncbi:hypothetical protein OBBRIDRAFT_838105 [Obba rivulosa]|uniref:Uncharacterized protein n=1 Tax=Obba rivulosa TaxID=1052685 RepID=A0A8E2AKZ5_9APHY|nr:hypothetical protein OBBRIDRAFT_838105 [Obba rivulosa]
MIIPSQLADANRQQLRAAFHDKILPLHHPVVWHVRRIVAQILEANRVGILDDDACLHRTLMPDDAGCPRTTSLLATHGLGTSFVGVLNTAIAADGRGHELTLLGSLCGGDGHRLEDDELDRCQLPECPAPLQTASSTVSPTPDGRNDELSNPNLCEGGDGPLHEDDRSSVHMQLPAYLAMLLAVIDGVAD